VLSLLDLWASLQGVLESLISGGAFEPYKFDASSFRGFDTQAMQLQMRITSVTGPGAPHYYKFVRRRDLGIPMPAEHGHIGANELKSEILDFPSSMKRDGRDVVVVVKNFMGDKEASQVIALAPFHLADKFLSGMLHSVRFLHLRRSLKLQTAGRLVVTCRSFQLGSPGSFTLIGSIQECSLAPISPRNLFGIATRLPYGGEGIGGAGTEKCGCKTKQFEVDGQTHVARA